MIEILPNWHPIFVHFTVAMITSAVIMFIIGYVLYSVKWRDQMLIVAHWNFWIGTVSAVITAIAGWFAYNSVAHDSVSHAAMTVHRNWAIGTLVSLFVVATWLIVSKRAWHKLSYPFLATVFLSFSLLVTTSWYGGELVYRYGLGVMSMPMMRTEGKVQEGDGHGGHVHENDVSTSTKTTVNQNKKPQGHDGHDHEH